MKKPDLSLLARFGVLAKPYWYSEEKRKARGLLLLLILLLVGETAANVFFNRQSGEFASALAAGDSARFWRSVRVFCGLLLVAVPIYSYYYYVRDKLAINWRQWLTHRVLTSYFADHAFYRLLKTPEIDNPDQRIAEDISTFTLQTLNIMVMLAGADVSATRFQPSSLVDLSFPGPVSGALRRGRHTGYCRRFRTKDGFPLFRKA